MFNRFDPLSMAEARHTRNPRGGAPVVTVSTLADLSKITQRGLAPTLARGSRVQLRVVPEDDPRRSRWEHALSRDASVCGCELAAVGLVITVGVLLLVRVVAGITITLAVLPPAVSWAIFCVTVVIVTKLGALYIAARSLRRLQSKIASRTANSRLVS